MNASISRRTALRTGAAAGAAGVGMTVAAAAPVRAAQDATATGMRSERLEVDWTPVEPVSIVRAGSGPPQRGDHFYLDAPIYAAGDVNGTQIGTYQCFGVWTAAATDTDAPTQRLTTTQYRFDDGVIAGLINEGGANQPALEGAVHGGTGRYFGALGSFRQIGSAQGVATPGAPAPGPGTPAAGQVVVRAVFDLILPESS
jgi:hypothetical protein